MIKKKKGKKNIKKKTAVQILLEYVRTAAIAFLAACIFTVLLSIHARNEMVKDLYASKDAQQKIKETIAKQLIGQADFAKDLKDKSSSVCIHVGDLYYSAHEYENAQLAYELALKKARVQNYILYYKLTKTLIAQDKIEEANEIISSVKDIKNKNLIMFKSQAYKDMGDKYYSIGKFLKAAKCYEKAKYYYDKFEKRDKSVENSLKTRIINAYIQTADVMVKSGYNSDALRFLKRAEKLDANNFNIRYKIAIVYSDLDPVKSIDYFEKIMEVRPQDIDCSVYTKALMKSANIEEWQGNATQAKYYRYKIHSVDMFNARKVVYKNDIDIYLDKFVVKKSLFRYRLDALYKFVNTSNSDIYDLYADFVLKYKDKISETVTIKCVDRKDPLLSNGGESQEVNVRFGKSIFTKKELDNYRIEIYLYKDSKYKTLSTVMKVPLKTISQN